MTELPTSRSSSPDGHIRLEVYKVLVEMADRVSQRRQAANSFYLSINTATAAGSTLLTPIAQPAAMRLIVLVAGLAISFLWSRSIESYRTLNAAKFSVITNIEVDLGITPFGNEWKVLDPDGDGKRHVPFHKIEVLVPWVFVGLYVVQGLVVLTGH